MSRTHLLIAVAATVLAACSGDQSPTGTGQLVGAVPPTPSHVEITGFIEATGHDFAPVALRYYNELIRLGGSEATLMAGLVGAEALVRGTQDVDGGLFVESFRVLAINGHKAIDGVLTSYDGPNYAVRLDDGTMWALDDPPADLTTHVGARVWVTGGTDGQPLEFGVIQDGRSE